eukprot:6824837-Prymnesium_polylepis.1
MQQAGAALNGTGSSFNGGQRRRSMAGRRAPVGGVVGGAPLFLEQGLPVLLLDMGGARLEGGEGHAQLGVADGARIASLLDGTHVKVSIDRFSQVVLPWHGAGEWSQMQAVLKDIDVMLGVCEYAKNLNFVNATSLADMIRHCKQELPQRGTLTLGSFTNCECVVRYDVEMCIMGIPNPCAVPLFTATGDSTSRRLQLYQKDNPLGLRWRKVDIKPTGRELNNKQRGVPSTVQKLATELQIKPAFTLEEWREFRIDTLHMTDFITVS